jgi:membrane fusion protein (multidrug efflux system)
MVAQVTSGTAEPPQEFMGHVEAIETVNVMPQVAGYLKTVHFEEGAQVGAGDVLFTIEKAPFEARVAQAEAAVQQAEANLPAARADLEAAKANLVQAEKYFERLKNADARSVVQAELDKASADYQQAKARVQQGDAAVRQAEAALEQARANQRLARIDLGYAEIRAPIDGRIGKALMTEGNYVTPASGALARIVQTDPIRVVYSVPDREYLTLLALPAEEREDIVETRLRLPNDSLYPDPGEWSFADNEMDPSTGTIALRANFANPDGLLVPKTYVSVLLQRAGQEAAAHVPSEAVMVDGRGEFVYVVTADDLVEERRVTLGEQIDDNRIVKDGLAPGERVIVRGLQKVQPGQPVQAAPEQTSPKGQ